MSVELITPVAMEEGAPVRDPRGGRTVGAGVVRKSPVGQERSRGTPTWRSEHQKDTDPAEASIPGFWTGDRRHRRKGAADGGKVAGRFPSDHIERFRSTVHLTATRKREQFEIRTHRRLLDIHEPPARRSTP